MNFINRKIELAFLHEKWQEENSQFLVIWGKRRVGKTELIKEFIANKPNVYFLGESTSETEQLRRFSTALSGFFHEPLLRTRGFGEWEEVFQYLQEKDQRMILVID